MTCGLRCTCSRCLHLESFVHLLFKERPEKKTFAIRLDNIKADLRFRCAYIKQALLCHSVIKMSRLKQYVTNKVSHPFYLDEFTIMCRGIKSNFSF